MKDQPHSIIHMPPFPQVDHNCNLCPRLATFRESNRIAFPHEFNAPVPSFGAGDGQLLIVGLAPGLRGANFTGRPFTGDFAGDLLYATMQKFGLATGAYQQHIDDGLTLQNTLLTNAVRCVPPENKPTGAEIIACRPFLNQTILAMPALKTILVLGRIAHDSTVRALGASPAKYGFKHAGQHQLGNITLISSYHCSRYNTNTGKLTVEMFEAVFKLITSTLHAPY